MKTVCASTMPFLIAWCIFFFAIEVFAARFAGRASLAGFDYRAFYTAGYLLRHQPAQLYDLAQQEKVQNELISSGRYLPYYHPSYEAFIDEPFARLSYQRAYLAYLSFNMLLLLLVFFSAREIFSSKVAKWRLWPGFALLLFLPLLILLLEGQDTILFLLDCCCTWNFLRMQRPGIAGLILGLALFKFQLAIPIAILLSIRCGWRFMSGFLITMAGVVLVCIGIIGAPGSMDYAWLIFHAASAIDKGGAMQWRLSITPLAMPNLTGLIYACGGRLMSSAGAFNAVVSLCSALVLVICAFFIRRAELKISVAIAILCALVVSYHLYTPDLTLAVFPVMLMGIHNNRYVVLSLFVVPAVLIWFGLPWFFLMALPMLFLLTSALLIVRRRAMPIVSYAESIQA